MSKKNDNICKELKKKLKLKLIRSSTKYGVNVGIY